MEGALVSTPLWQTVSSDIPLVTDGEISAIDHRRPNTRHHRCSSWASAAAWLRRTCIAGRGHWRCLSDLWRRARRSEPAVPDVCIACARRAWRTLHIEWSAGGCLHGYRRCCPRCLMAIRSMFLSLPGQAPAVVAAAGQTPKTKCRRRSVARSLRVNRRPPTRWRAWRPRCALGAGSDTPRWRDLPAGDRTHQLPAGASSALMARRPSTCRRCVPVPQ